MRYVTIYMYLLFKTLYMSKQATKDEDLIILSEDTEVAHELPELTLDLPEESDNSDIITFWDEEISLELDDTTEEVSGVAEEEIILTLDNEETAEIVVEESKEWETESSKEDASDFSFDLTTEESSEEVVEVKEEETAPSADLDFGGFDLTTTQESMWTAHDDPTWIAEVATAVTATASMNSILEDTVAKLEARKDAIADEKSGKTAKVADLKAEIKKLEDEVLNLEGEVEGLDEEAEKITANIDGLQDMKLWNEDAVKEHNSNRVMK